MTISKRRAELRPEHELNRVIPLQQAAEIRGVSVDTIRRRFPEIIVQLSPRRIGVRLRDALNLPAA